jgi:nucleoside-diphosphate-sugar epimerase
VKYCVTGGSGFIGAYFCRALREAGHEVVILDLIEPPANAPHDRFVQGDVRDPEACRAALEGCDRVVHLAAAHHDFGIADETFFEVNERGAKVLSDAMDEFGVRTICFYSTVAVYGDAPRPHEETTEPQPLSPYGASKLAAERVLEQWTERGEGRRSLVIRPTVTFGVDNFANMYSLIRQIVGGKFVFVGAASNIKSLSYIENIVDATLFMFERDGRPAFEVFNYVEKPDMTSRQISLTIYDALGKTPPKRSIPMGLARLLALPFDVAIALTGRNIPISTARIRKLFVDETLFEADRIREAGFVPSVELDEGIRRMVAWYVDKGCHASAAWHQPPAEVVPYRSEAGVS